MEQAGQAASLPHEFVVSWTAIVQLAILTAVLAAIAAAEAGGGPVTGVAWRLVVVTIAASIAPLAALIGSHRLATSPTQQTDAEDRVSRLETLVILVWLAAVAVMLLVCQWPRIVRSNWQLSALPLVDEVAILLPVLAPLLFIWAASYQFERAATPGNGPGLFQYVWLQVRHQLALVLLPPLAVVAVVETAQHIPISVGKIDTAWWFILPLLGMTLVLMPVAIRCLWQTAPLAAGQLRTALDEQRRQRNCRLREILVWQTNGTMANAAVIGISPWLRYLLLTDVLLARLSDDQVMAVVRHELAHVRRWHLHLRLAALLLPVAWWAALKPAWPALEATMAPALASIGIHAGLLTSLLVPLGLLSYAVIVVGWYSRLLEHDADLDACLNDAGQIDAAMAVSFCTALITVCGRGSDSLLNRWLHPALEDRIQFLRSVLIDNQLARSFRRRLTLVAATLAALLIAAGVVALRS